VKLTAISQPANINSCVSAQRKISLRNIIIIYYKEVKLSRGIKCLFTSEIFVIAVRSFVE
jgi:hypothetical protein